MAHLVGVADLVQGNGCAVQGGPPAVCLLGGSPNVLHIRPLQCQPSRPLHPPNAALLHRQHVAPSTHSSTDMSKRANEACKGHLEDRTAASYSIRSQIASLSGPSSQFNAPTGHTTDVGVLFTTILSSKRGCLQNGPAFSPSQAVSQQWQAVERPSRRDAGFCQYQPPACTLACRCRGH